MKIRLHTLALVMLASFFSCKVCAVNLMDVYLQAANNDPQFKAANAQWLSDRENLAISRAALFPTLSASGNIGRSYERDEGGFARGEGTNVPQNFKGYFNLAQYQINLSQPLFNFGNWASVWGAQASTKASQATFYDAYLNLMQRAAQAYFSVLLAKQQLNYATGNRKALEEQLEQVKNKYDVGLSPITDLENARANYDTAIAAEIAAKNVVSDKIEQLSELTGVKYETFDLLKSDFPLVKPTPANIELWVHTAEQQNYSLLAARFSALAAREAIKSANAGHLPTLNATGNFTYNYAGADPGPVNFQKNQTTQGGLSLTVPLFQGGQVVAQARQANYLYQKAIANQEKTHRSIISQTRQAYLGILSGISKLKADKQAIISNESGLRSTRLGYSAGVNTMLDVLQKQSDLFSSQQTYAQDQYNYIVTVLTLKQLAATLTPNDLRQMNSWLTSTSNYSAKGAAHSLVHQTKMSTKRSLVNKPKCSKKHPASVAKPQPKAASNVQHLPKPTPALTNHQPTMTPSTSPISNNQAPINNSKNISPTPTTTSTLINQPVTKTVNQTNNPPTVSQPTVNAAPTPNNQSQSSSQSNLNPKPQQARVNRAPKAKAVKVVSVGKIMEA